MAFLLRKVTCQVARLSSIRSFAYQGPSTPAAPHWLVRSASAQKIPGGHNDYVRIWSVIRKDLDDGVCSNHNRRFTYFQLHEKPKIGSDL